MIRGLGIFGPVHVSGGLLEMDGFGVDSNEIVKLSDGFSTCLEAGIGTGGTGDARVSDRSDTEGASIVPDLEGDDRSSDASDALASNSVSGR